MPRAEFRLLDFAGCGDAFSPAADHLPGLRVIRIVHRNLLSISVDVANRGISLPRFATSVGYMMLAFKLQLGTPRSRPMDGFRGFGKVNASHVCRPVMLVVIGRRGEPTGRSVPHTILLSKAYKARPGIAIRRLGGRPALVRQSRTESSPNGFNERQGLLADLDHLCEDRSGGICGALGPTALTQSREITRFTHVEQPRRQPIRQIAAFGHVCAAHADDSKMVEDFQVPLGVALNLASGGEAETFGVSRPQLFSCHVTEGFGCCQTGRPVPPIAGWDSNAKS